MKTLYLGLCVLGTILPYSQFIPFLREHGLDARLFLEQLFATRIGGFFGMDVIVSSVVLWVFVSCRRAQTGTCDTCGLRLRPILAVGVSLGLPLFLYLRERRLQPS